MVSRINVQKMGIAAILIAIGVIITLFSPVQLVLEPASFTLALHAPIFIAMFISPLVAISVAAGTTLGFLLGDFPIMIVLRAASHVLFALIGALYLQYRPQILSSSFQTLLFAFVIGIIHAWAEVTLVGLFDLSYAMPGTYYTASAVVLLIGLGGMAHSLVDFAIAIVALKFLTSQKALQPLFVTSRIIPPKAL
ncbi:MAG: hypothetical protein LBV76_02935 [Deltaproteobacteria bacterium]|nr:hypothetical protein [Deltaproteobacteria bacterium]